MSISKKESSQAGLNPHTELVNQILVTISKRKDCRVWKAQAGTFSDLYSNRIIKVGLPGAADITGILKRKDGAGVRIEIEVKTGSGKQRIEQIRFEQMINNLGGHYYVARSVDGAIQFLDRVANLS